MRLISRSSHEAFSQCKRKGYWNFIYMRGLEPTEIQWHFAIGLAVHKGQEILLTQDGDVEAAVEGVWGVLKEYLPEELPFSELPFATQQNCFLAEALCRGWHRTRYQAFIEKFEVLAVEKESRTLLAPNIKLMARADAIVRDRISGAIYVINWKTAKSIKDWTQKWEDYIQAWTEALDAQEQMGEEVTGVLFEGFYKHTDYKGVSTSPLLTAYRTGGESPTYSWEGSKAKGKEWSKFSTWLAFPGGLKAWIAFLPFDVVDAQFITSSPILKNDDMVRDWLRQVVREETDIEGMLDPEVPEADRLSFFKQNKGDACRWCQFRPACRWEISIDDMVASGMLQVRKDHHLIEGEKEG